MRKRISQINTFPVFSPKTEYEKIADLFYNASEFGRLVGPLSKTRARPDMSYYDCLNGTFLDWHLRGSFITAEEMMQQLQISPNDFENEVTEERLLDYIQFVLNAIIYVKEKIHSMTYNIYQASDTIYHALIDNSIMVVNHLGAEIITEDREIYIVYKDDVATAISQENKELRTSIIEYLKIDNHADLQRKGEVLCTLAKKLEPHEKALNSTEFKQLCSDTTFLLNNIGARHYQNPDNKIGSRFIAMNEKELESWYDKAFHMFLACMAVVPYLDCKSTIKALKNP